VEDDRPELTEAETWKPKGAPSLENRADPGESAEPAVVGHVDSSGHKGEF